MSLAIRGTRVLIDGILRPGVVHVEHGVITGIDTTPAADEMIDAGDDIVMPGLVDTHVHVNEPGRTEWEGFASATRAAAAGGVTTLFDMPLNSIPATTSLAALEVKRLAARDRIHVDVGCIGGVVPGNAGELPALAAAGVRLFKCFLVPSGVDEFPCVGEHDLREALPILSRLGATLLVHAELPAHIAPMARGDPRHYATYLASRPALAEIEAVAMMIRLAEEFVTRVHIVHVSSQHTLPLISTARARGVAITCETCPHYLTFAADEIGDGRTEFKCAPPIRGGDTREALWRAVIDGDIDLIASDHSPCPPALKSPELGDFFQAWGGIASLQLGLPAVWSEGRRRGLGVARLSELMSTAPARLAGLEHRNGRLAPGFDADLVIWSPDAPVDVDALTLYHRHALTPYRGALLTGAVRATYVRGAAVYREGRVTTSLSGQLVQ